MKTEKQIMNKIKQEICNSHSARHSGKAEKSLKLPSNVNKNSSDKRKKIHWYTSDIRQKHKSSVVIPSIMITFDHLAREDPVLLHRDREKASRIV